MRQAGLGGWGWGQSEHLAHPLYIRFKKKKKKEKADVLGRVIVLSVFPPLTCLTAQERDEVVT